MHLSMIFKIMMSLFPIMILSLLFYTLNKMEKWDHASSSVFECGFGSYLFNRFSFTSQYFMISMIFVMLDLEFCIMMPYLFSTYMVSKTFFLFIFLVFSILLALTLEWSLGSLNWKF